MAQSLYAKYIILNDDVKELTNKINKHQ